MARGLLPLILSEGKRRALGIVYRCISGINSQRNNMHMRDRPRGLLEVFAPPGATRISEFISLNIAATVSSHPAFLIYIARNMNSATAE